MHLERVGEQYLSSPICFLFFSSFSTDFITKLESQMLENLAKHQKCFACELSIFIEWEMKCVVFLITSSSKQTCDIQCVGKRGVSLCFWNPCPLLFHVCGHDKMVWDGTCLNRFLFPYRSGVRKSKVKMLADLVVWWMLLYSSKMALVTPSFRGEEQWDLKLWKVEGPVCQAL